MTLHRQVSNNLLSVHWFFFTHNPPRWEMGVLRR